MGLTSEFGIQEISQSHIIQVHEVEITCFLKGQYVILKEHVAFVTLDFPGLG